MRSTLVEGERLLLVEAESPCDISVGLLAVCTGAALLVFARGITSVQLCVSWTNQPSQETLCLVSKHQISMHSRMCPVSLHKHAHTNSYQLDSQVLTVRINTLVKFILVLNMLTFFSQNDWNIIIWNFTVISGRTINCVNWTTDLAKILKKGALLVNQLWCTIW